jgi:hypothetical protein
MVNKMTIIGEQKAAKVAAIATDILLVSKPGLQPSIEQSANRFT